jgi:hypothetical protein
MASATPHGMPAVVTQRVVDLEAMTGRAALGISGTEIDWRAWPPNNAPPDADFRH